jgi:hypothetical protein
MCVCFRYPDPEVAPHSLVYRINDDLEFQVDVHEFNGCATLNTEHPSACGVCTLDAAYKGWVGV